MPNLRDVIWWVLLLQRELVAGGNTIYIKPSNRPEGLYEGPRTYGSVEDGRPRGSLIITSVPFLINSDKENELGYFPPVRQHSNPRPTTPRPPDINRYTFHCADGKPCTETFVIPHKTPKPTFGTFSEIDLGKYMDTYQDLLDYYNKNNRPSDDRQDTIKVTSPTYTYNDGNRHYAGLTSRNPPRTSGYRDRVWDRTSTVDTPHTRTDLAPNRHSYPTYSTPSTNNYYTRTTSYLFRNKPDDYYTHDTSRTYDGGRTSPDDYRLTSRPWDNRDSPYENSHDVARHKPVRFTDRHFYHDNDRYHNDKHYYSHNSNSRPQWEQLPYRPPNTTPTSSIASTSGLSRRRKYHIRPLTDYFQSVNAYQSSFTEAPTEQTTTSYYDDFTSTEMPDDTTTIDSTEPPDDRTYWNSDRRPTPHIRPWNRPNHHNRRPTTVRPHVYPTNIHTTVRPHVYPIKIHTTVRPHYSHMG